MFEDIGARAPRDYGHEVNSALKTSLEADLPGKRDGARHALLRQASLRADPELWDLVGSHLRSLRKDMRPNVLRALIEETYIEKDRQWAQRVLDTPNHAPSENVVNLDAERISREKRLKREKALADRKARDIENRAKSRGSSEGKPLHKQNGKKKSK